MKVVVFQGEDGWRFRTVADNGEKLTVSESYDSKGNAVRAAKLMMEITSVTLEIEVGR